MNYSNENQIIILAIYREIDSHLFKRPEYDSIRRIVTKKEHFPEVRNNCLNNEEETASYNFQSA